MDNVLLKVASKILFVNVGFVEVFCHHQRGQIVTLPI